MTRQGRHGDRGSERPESKGQRTFVLHPDLRRSGAEGRSPEARLAEAVGLALAIDLEVVDRRLVRLTRPRPATLLGQGHLDEIGAAIAAQDIGLCVVDAALTPVQQRNLERAWKCKVIDRTGLILEIFGARARTKEGQLQVELAALTYQRSRLVRSWTHLERQRGGFGFLGGPGESQLEIDRRLISERIARIKQDLEAVKRTRHLHRRARQRVPYPVIALVGYTNAGKSTLFNSLTGAKVMAQEMLFATLDPTMRRFQLPNGQDVILSDTVGFISDLPTSLVAAFRATLEEVDEADLILHVRDVSHPDSEAQRADVLAVLEEMGLELDTESQMIEVLNKIDLLPPEERRAIGAKTGRRPWVVAVSAVTGAGLPDLLAAIAEAFAALRQTYAFQIPYAADGAALAWLHDHGEVLWRREGEQGLEVEVRLDAQSHSRFLRRFGAALRQDNEAPAAEDSREIPVEPL